MQFRQATKVDIPTLAQMRWNYQFEKKSKEPAASEAEYIQDFSGFLERGLEKDEWVIWIAEEENKIVSHAFIRIISLLPKPHKLRRERVTIHGVYTLPEYRNKGIGSQLMKHVVEWSQERGIETLLLWPSEKSKEFYKREGFVFDTEIMTKKLKDLV